MEKALTMAQLPYHSGIKLRVYPSDLQKKIIKRNSDDARATYNQLVEYGKRQFELEQLGVRTFEQQVELEKIRDFEASSKSMKELLPFLDVKEHDSSCTAQAIASYKAAWNMFRKIGSHNPPTFHKRNDNFQRYQSSNNYSPNKSKDLYNGSVKFVNKNTIQIPKVGKLRVSGSHKKLLALKHAVRIGSITIKKEADDCYYVSLALASEKPFKMIKKTNHKTASIDLNTSNFLTTSDGHKEDNPRYYKTLQSTLAKAQRDLNRKRRRAEKEKRQLKDSKNYQKQRKVVAKIHKKIANQRENFLQTLSTKLIKNHDLLVAEDLQSKNMMKNHSMALSIADVGWRSFLSMLQYKAERYDVDFRLVDPKNTSQICSVCGFVKTKDGIGGLQTLSGDNINKKHQLYHCFNCGVDLDRDLNATQNILARGLAQ